MVSDCNVHEGDTAMINTIADIKQACRMNNNKFFNKDTMKYWHSRVLQGVYGHRYFITSEANYNNTQRLYTVHEYLDGSINTIGEFQAYSTAYLAQKEAKRLASQLETQCQN